MVASTASPPGPLLQRANAILHQEPIASLAHGCFWGLVLLVSTPIALFGLLLRCAYRLLVALLPARASAYDPRLHKETYEMAVVITGCDSGFGHELALWAADAGYTVFAGCLHAELESNGSAWPDRIIVVPMDVTSDAQVDAVVVKVREWLGSADHDDDDKRKRVLHALVNNAGVGVGGLIDWAELKDFEFCMKVNYLGMVRCCKAFLPIFKQQAIERTFCDGRILNVTSMAGLVTGSMGLAAYAASKHAANAFSAVLRTELASSFGLQVTTVNPSFHGTPLVHGMGDAASQDWDKLDPVKKQEYGPAFYDRYRYLTVDIPRMASWNVDIVCREVLKCLKMKQAPPDLLIGSDARLLLPIVRIVPAWCADMILSLQWLPIPAAMTNKD